MKPKESLHLAILATVTVGVAAGCSGGSSETSDEFASLSVSLMDAPVDDVKEVNVEITAIWLKSADEDDGPPFQLPLEDAPLTVNLLELSDENAAILVDGALIGAGAYEWLAMDVNATIDNVFDSYAVTITEEWKEIFVPSGRVRLVEGFEVEANQAAQLLFDWDLRKGLVYPPGLGGGYILKPAFRVIDVTQFGTLSGAVAVDTVMLEANECNVDSEVDDYDVGNVVYVFAGHDVVPDDIDEVDPEPLATVDAVLNETSTHYEYRTLLPFGDYTVAFTCQGGNDLADADDTGNEDPMLDTVAFFEPAANVTIGGAPENLDVEVDF